LAGSFLIFKGFGPSGLVFPAPQIPNYINIFIPSGRNTRSLAAGMNSSPERLTSEGRIKRLYNTSSEYLAAGREVVYCRFWEAFFFESDAASPRLAMPTATE